MSRLFIIALSSFLACVSLYSETPDDRNRTEPVYVLAGQDIKPVTVFLKKQADCLVIPLTITSDQKELSDKFTEIRQVRDLILKKTDENTLVKMQAGPVSLSTKTGLKILSISSYTSGENNTQMQLCLLLPLSAKNGDVFECANELKRFIDSIPLPSKAKLALGEFRLAIENPERYRPELLRLISEEVNLLRKTFGDNSEVTITNIQSPVSIRQVDDRNVEIYISYSMSMTIPE